MPIAHRQARWFLSRTILTITVFGIAINVIVAWCCAILIDVEEKAAPAVAITISDREAWRVVLWTCAGADSVLSQRYFARGGPSSKTKPSALALDHHSQD